MFDDGSDPTEYIDRGSEATYLSEATKLRGVDSACFVNLMLEVGETAVIGLVASYVVRISTQVYIHTMRALGVFPFGTMEAAAAIPGNGNDNSDNDNNDDSDDDGVNRVDRRAEALNHRRGDRNINPEEKRDVFLKFVIGVDVLLVSVFVFAWVFGTVSAVAAGSELPLSGYVFIVAAFAYRFTRELFPQFGTCAKQLFDAFLLMLHSRLALSRVYVANVKRVLCMGSRAISKTMQNMLRFVGQIDWNTVWAARTVIWSTIGTFGIHSWNKTCAVVRISWNAIWASLHDIWSSCRAAGNSLCCTNGAAHIIVWTPLWASRGFVWSKLCTTWILLWFTIFGATEVLCITIFAAAVLLCSTIGTAREVIWAPLWAALWAGGSAIVASARLLKAQVFHWRKDTRPELIQYDEEPIHAQLPSPIQIHESPADLEASVWLKVPRNHLVPKCTRLRSRQVSVYTPQLVAERFACGIEGLSYRNNCYDSDTRDVAGSQFRRKEGGVVTRNAAGLERYCESFTYVSGNRCMPEISGNNPGQGGKETSSATTVDSNRAAVNPEKVVTLDWGRGRRKGKRWRKFQKLVSQNSEADYLLDFFPNGNPRTRPAPRRYSRPTVRRCDRGVKRRVMEASFWYTEMMAKIRLYPDPMYCSDAQQPLKKVKLMDPDEALRTMEIEFANRPLVFEGREVHCCTINPMHKRELWVYAKFLDDSGSKKIVAGGLTYLPVTLLRPSFSENLTGQGPKWYVQPGGWHGREKWAGEESRVIWEVSQDILFNKRCNWVPGMVERFCNDCADAPRQRHIKGCNHSRNLGFKWVKACNCRGGNHAACSFCMG